MSDWIKVAAANLMIEMRPTDKLDDVASIIRAAYAPHAAKVRTLVEVVETHKEWCAIATQDELEDALRAVKEDLDL